MRETSEAGMMSGCKCSFCTKSDLYQKLIFLYTKGIFFVCVQIYGFNDIGAIDIDTR